MAGSNTDLTIRIRGQLNGAIRDLDRLESKLSGVARSASRAERGWRRAAVSIHDFAKAGLAANVAFAAIKKFLSGVGGAVRGVVEAGLSMERLERRFRFAAGSAGEGARAFAHVREEATRLGFGMREIAAAYNRLSTATRGTSLEGARTREIFTAVAEAARVMGLTTEEASDALTAVGRIAAKGVVSVDDLRGQLGERIPGALQIAARAMGKTDEEFNALLETGRVLATDLLPAMARQMRDEFAAAVPEASATAEAAFGRLGSAVEDLRNSIARSGVLDWLASVSEALADLVREDTPLEALAERVARVAELERRVEHDRARGVSGNAKATFFRNRAELAALMGALTADLRRGGAEGAERVAELLAEAAQAEAEIESRLAAARAEAAADEAARRSGAVRVSTGRRPAGPSAAVRAKWLQEEWEAAQRLTRVYSALAAILGQGLDEVSGAAREAGGAAKEAADETGDAADAAGRRVLEIARRNEEALERLTLGPLELARAEMAREVEELEAHLAAGTVAAEIEERARAAIAARFAEAFRAVRRAESDPGAAPPGEAPGAPGAPEPEGPDPAADAVAAIRRDIAAVRAEIDAGAEAMARARNPWLAAARDGLAEYAADAADATDEIAAAGARMAKGLEDAFVRLASTGKLSFRDLTQSILADLTRIAVRQSIVGPLASGLFGALGLGGPAAAPAGGGVPEIFHRGGIAGGLRPNEVPAILTRGEGVFTPEQMRALAPAGAGAPRVDIRFENRGTPQREVARRTEFDGRDWVIAVVVEDVEEGGPFSRALSRNLGGATG